MALKVYPNGKGLFAEKLIAWTADTIGLLLVQNVPIYDATDVTIANVLASGNLEVTSAGYARTNLAGKSSLANGDFWDMKASDTAFPSMAAGQTIGAAIMYHDTGLGNNNKVLAWYDGGSIPNELPAPTGGIFTVQWLGGVCIRF